MFDLDNIQIRVEYTNNITYSLITTSEPAKETSDYYKVLTQQSFVDMKDAARDVLTLLLKSTDDLKIRLDEEFPPEPEENWELLQ
jgi:hypothetical protein